MAHLPGRVSMRTRLPLCGGPLANTGFATRDIRESLMSIGFPEVHSGPESGACPAAQMDLEQGGIDGRGGLGEGAPGGQGYGPMQEQKKMRTIVVDDYPPFLMALIALLGGKSGVEVVGQAHNGMDALKLAETERPDLVLVDFTMPGMNGAEVASKLKAQPWAPKVVIMSFHADSEYRDLALHAGADAYLVKTDMHQELVPLLQRLRS